MFVMMQDESEEGGWESAHSDAASDESMLYSEARGADGDASAPGSLAAAVAARIRSGIDRADRSASAPNAVGSASVAGGILRAGVAAEESFLSDSTAAGAVEHTHASITYGITTDDPPATALENTSSGAFGGVAGTEADTLLGSHLNRGFTAGVAGTGSAGPSSLTSSPMRGAAVPLPPYRPTASGAPNNGIAASGGIAGVSGTEAPASTGSRAGRTGSGAPRFTPRGSESGSAERRAIGSPSKSFVSAASGVSVGGGGRRRRSLGGAAAQSPASFATSGAVLSSVYL